MSIVAGIGKGIVAGAAAVTAVVAGLDALELFYARIPSGEVGRLVFQFGIVPALVTGAIAGGLGAQLTRYRRVMLGGLAVAAVIALGVCLDRELIPFGIAIALPCALWLEAWTRPADVAPAAVLPATSVYRGALLGFGAVLAVAAVVATAVLIEPRLAGWSGDGEEAGWGFGPYVEGHDRAAQQIGMIIAFIGMLPGIVAGLLLGRFADEMLDWPARARAIVLATCAVSSVALLGMLTQQQVFIAPACVPVAAVALVLERWTRRPPSAVQLPRATVV
jgi:hypothetical protein